MDERFEPGEDLDRLANAVIGAAIEVHRHLGPGYAENVYADALEVELKLRRIPYSREHEVSVSYKSVAVGKGYIDFLICGVLIVELKVVEALNPVHSAQVISYLKATGLTLGLLLNFNHSQLKNGIKRVINT